MHQQSATNVVSFPARPGPQQPVTAAHRWTWPPPPHRQADRDNTRAVEELRWSVMLHRCMSEGVFPANVDSYGPEFDALGFRFAPPRGGWAATTLPTGWKWSWRDARTGKPARPFVVDGEGRDRVSFLIAGKAPETHAYVLRRYMVREVDHVPRPRVRILPASMLAIHDAGVPTDDAMRFDAHDRESRHLAASTLQATLDAKYPRHKDCLAYW